METLKVNLTSSYDYNKWYTKTFEVVEDMPQIEYTIEGLKADTNHNYSEIVDIEKVEIDTYNNDDLFTYDYYKLTKFNNDMYQFHEEDEKEEDENYLEYEYIAIKVPENRHDEIEVIAHIFDLSINYINDIITKYLDNEGSTIVKNEYEEPKCIVEFTEDGNKIGITALETNDGNYYYYYWIY